MVDALLTQQRPEPAAVLGQGYRVGWCSPDGHASSSQAMGEIDGCLPAKLYDHSVGLF